MIYAITFVSDARMRSVSAANMTSVSDARMGWQRAQRRFCQIGQDMTNLLIACALASIRCVCFDLRRAVHPPKSGAFVFRSVVPHVLGENAHDRARFFYTWRHSVIVCVYILCLCVCVCGYLCPVSESLLNRNCERV